MNLGFALSLVSEWELAGVESAVVSPGSRSTPIAVALARSSKIRLHVILDERSAGFFALGLAKASRVPTVVVTTSGTAAANLRPCVTEAFHSGIPLIVVTADRPLELHKVGAAQTMEQEELFSDVVLFRASPSVPDEANKAHWRPLASRAFHESASNPLRRGPVHLNLAFREPLMEPDPQPTGPRELGKSWYQLHYETDETLLFNELARSERVLVIAAGSDVATFPGVLNRCEDFSWPIIADTLSGLRRVSDSVMTGFEAFLRSDNIVKMLVPDHIVLLGGDLASMNVNNFVQYAARQGSRVIRVTNRWFWQDPFNVVGDIFVGSFETFFSKLMPISKPTKFFELCMEVDRAATSGMNSSLAGKLTEPTIAIELYKSAGANDLIYASSSMPIRDLEWFAPGSEKQPPSVYSNRGVNGIDGVVSSYLGAATAQHGHDSASSSYLLIGDLALRHDIGVLSSVAVSEMNLFLCVVDNEGGGIFSFLPQASVLDEDAFEELFGTPQPGDLRAIAEGFGLYTRRVSDLDSFCQELRDFRETGGVRLVIASSERQINVSVHQATLNEGMYQAEQALGIGR